METNRNLFFDLHRWAVSQDENFITEAFAYLLQHLTAAEPGAALVILDRLSGNRFKWTFDDLNRISIRTQVATELGTPDIEVSTDEKLVYIEVKVESGFGFRQMTRYGDQLRQSGFQQTLLVVLTKNPFECPTDEEHPDVVLRWHLMAECLEDLEMTDNTSAFLVQQFVAFLKRRGLAMDIVSWELVRGVRSLMNLMDMLNEALTANGVQHSFSAGGRWYGYYVENKTFFVALHYETPECITFKTYQKACDVKAEDLEFGSIDAGDWVNRLQLDSEELHFFARTKGSQMKCLEDFIRRSLNYGRNLIR